LNLRGKIVFITIGLMLMMLSPISVQASHLLFEHREQTTLSRGVIYERNRQVTTAGLLDVHILTVPLNDPNITVAPIESHRELGLRETTLNLVSGAGAIAGINADFFGMIPGSNHSLAFGPVIADGQLHSISASYNRGYNEFATFFIDQNGFPFMRYITPNVVLLVNGRHQFNYPYSIASVNKVHNLYRPVIITREGMMFTTSLIQRFPHLNLVKTIVEDGIVTGVSNPGQAVYVPENGFVLVTTAEAAFRYRTDLWRGNQAEFHVYSSNLEMGFSQINTAIGGGGLILFNGQIVHDTGVAPPGRHPRSAIGITHDRRNLILMTVDGRTHSVGATHEEMANLLIRYGVADAMHFDGGGSATMVAQQPARGPLRVVNTLSEGSQRAVMNAFGIFDSSTPGAPTQLVLRPYERSVLRGGTLTLDVYGLDAYYHRIGINPAGVEFSAYFTDIYGNRQPASGSWNGNTYLPDRPGHLLIEARYGNLSVSKIYLVEDVMALHFSMSPILAFEGMVAPLALSGTTASGVAVSFGQDMGQVHFTVTPPELGFVSDNIFFPQQMGGGFITATLGNVQAHLPVSVGGHFESPFPIPQNTPFSDPLRVPITPIASGEAFDFSLLLPGYGSFNYYAWQAGRGVVLQMTAAQGGLIASDVWQWNRFINDIERGQAEFIIIKMDVNPLVRFGGRSQEFDLFHQALQNQQERGRTVFVVSNRNHTPGLTMRDGIRYIDLGMSGRAATIDFRNIGQQIWYDFTYIEEEIDEAFYGDEFFNVYTY